MKVDATCTLSSEGKNPEPEACLRQTSMQSLAHKKENEWAHQGINCKLSASLFARLR
jgi:hypothetical protein